MSQLKLFLIGLAFLPALLQAQDQAQSIEPVPAERVPLADESLILDVTRAGERFVAVGARGHVLVSIDGSEWEQAESVPVRATLTRVEFVGGRLWAVGHDTTIIHSTDLGRTWSLQYFKPLWDGPISERPLLDVHFFDANRGVAVGAYGLIMHTDDAGRTWTTENMEDQMTSEAIEWEQPEESDEETGDDPANEFYDASQDFDRGCYEFMECHLNAVLALDDQRVMLAAEGGYGFRSRDGGQTWESFRFPYPGSMFGLVPVSGGVMAFGLRGHVQLSRDFGDSWEELDTGVTSTLLGGGIDPQGYPVMVGAGATVLTYNPISSDFQVQQDRLGSDYAAVAFDENGTMILAGENGLSNE
ncbi:MAG: hypothetical protein GVY32_08265 [Gammaproteobacteria bacterium]|jgi:photosystem II stability/assembly factor-like uncharacterized protein|nr:hypothetical protein [Gammaproteobacteria bacterium]